MITLDSNSEIGVRGGGTRVGGGGDWVGFGLQITGTSGKQGQLK